MIIRIVRLSIAEEKLSEFLFHFKNSENEIRNFPGCLEMNLYKDTYHTGVMVTISKWEKAGDLEAYRNSPLFQSVWSKVKPLFSRKAEAFSVEEFER